MAASWNCSCWKRPSLNDRRLRCTDRVQLVRIADKPRGSGLLKRCVSLLADGAPILLGEPVEDAFLAFLLQASAPGQEPLADPAIDAGQDAIIRQLDVTGALERTTGLSSDGVLRLIGARAREAAGSDAASTAHVAILAPPDSSDLTGAYGLKAEVQVARDDLAALDRWLESLPPGATATIIVAPCRAGDRPSEGLTEHLHALKSWLIRLGRLDRPLPPVRLDGRRAIRLVRWRRCQCGRLGFRAGRDQ